jgi:hypothetical protein
MENLSDFYCYRFIGKLTVFFNFRSSSSEGPVLNCTVSTHQVST